MTMKPRKNAGISGAGGKNVAKPYAPEIFPMTHSQSIKFGKMNMSPKTSTTLFTLPKGTTKLPQSEKDAIQRRRTLDRQRTLARAKFIIKRDN